MQLPNGRSTGPAVVETIDFMEVARREAKRVYVRSLASVVGIYVTLLGGAVAVANATASTDIYGLALYVAFVAATPLVLGITWAMLRRGLWPAVEALAWVHAKSDEDWRAFDGQPAPLDQASALARLAETVGDFATPTRMSWLAASGNVSDLRRELSEWRPTDAVNLARHARLVSELARLDGVEADLDEAWAAAMAIREPVDRQRQLVMVLYLDAWRRAHTSRDPLSPLVRARRILGPGAREEWVEVGQTFQRLRARFFAVAAGVSGLITVVAVAGWSGALG